MLDRQPGIPLDAAAEPVLTDPRSPTIADFVTDGSIAALCDELTRLTGVPIWLRDATGRVIVPASGGTPWALVDEAEGVRHAFSVIGRSPDNTPRHEAPLAISTGVLGSIVAAVGAVDLSGAASGGEPGLDAVRRAVTFLASSVCDVCEAQVSLRRRVNELDALYRLSSLLVQADNTDEVLETALDLAIDVLGVDAGTISVIEESSEAPVLKASRGLGEGWLGFMPRVWADPRLVDGAMSGTVAECADLRAQTSGEMAEAAAAEGLTGLLCCGLVFHGRTLGTMCLFTKRARRFDDADRGLMRSIAEHAAGAVNDARLRRLREEHKRVQRQVDMAADVQRRMLPRAMPRIAGLDAAARYAPSFELGGDFYDFIDFGSNLGVLVGDVVGKGVPAAMLMSAVRASLRAHAQDVYDLRDVMSRVNAALAADTQDHEFATLWYGVVDPAQRRLTYIAAGHEPALLVRPDAADPARQPAVYGLHSGGMALGIDPGQRYEPGVFGLMPGDLLLAYTDGLTDAANFDGDRFGRARLSRVLRELLVMEPAASAARAVEHVTWHIRQFAGLSPRADDITLVALRVGAV